jgi:hypothetical protein
VTSAQRIAQALDGRRMTAIDPRLALLARASALFLLVEAGEIEIGEAIAKLRVALFEVEPCPCDTGLARQWEKMRKPQRRQYKRVA